MQSEKLNLCLIPLEINWEEKETNLSSVENLISLVHPDTDLIVLPETFSTGFPTGKEKDYIREFAERNTGRTIDFLKDLAKKHNMAIAGSFIADNAGSLYNRAFFIEPSEDEYYADKRHLFSPGGENKIFSFGRDRMKLRFRGWNISMIVCYDLRFPVWCRNVANEYDLLIAVANWPVKRIKVWDTLLVARALENMAYVCGVNCSGTDKNGSEYNGSSMVIDPIGKNITVRLEDSPLLYASLSKSKLENLREKFPAWRDADKFEIFD